MYGVVDWEVLGPALLQAIERIGLPGAVLLVVLYAAWRLGQQLTHAHLSFLDATSATLRQLAESNERTSRTLDQLARGQDQIHEFLTRPGRPANTKH